MANILEAAWNEIIFKLPLIFVSGLIRAALCTTVIQLEYNPFFIRQIYDFIIPQRINIIVYSIYIYFKNKTLRKKL